MKVRSTTIWIPLILLSFLFSLLYLWYTLFPGPIRPEAVSLFGMEQIQQGRAYSKGIRISFILNFMLQVAFLIWFLASGWGSRLSQACEYWAEKKQWLGFLAFYSVLWFMLNLISLPFTFFSGFYWQQFWGFSTQTLGFWWVDVLKQLLIDLGLGGVGALILYLLLYRWPRTWWIICSVLFSLWLIIQSLLWPVLVDPVFNNFQPITNVEIRNTVNELAAKAGLNIEEMLIMDASQRTTKANAYFAGVGETKRIVLYDNLLNKYSYGEVKAVIAHEIAHWQKGHITKALTLGSLGSFLIWGGAYIVLRQEMLKKTRLRRAFYMHPERRSRWLPLCTHKLILSDMPRKRIPPLVWAVMLLFIMLVNFASGPVQNSISRQMEIEADQTAVMLTKDSSAAIQLQVNLALRNRSDLSPPRFVEWFSYTHPSVLTRIESIREIEKEL